MTHEHHPHKHGLKARIRHWNVLLRHHLKRKKVRHGLMALGSALVIMGGLGVLWLSSLQIPNLDTFDSRKVSQSTKIFDRTGEILLFDIHEDAKRTVVPLSEMSPYVKAATVAIEDDTFYEHIGVRPISFLRAVVANIMTGSFSQGGSTITQQIIKNSLLTTNKTITRKLKEWVLALKIERVLTKDQILEIYLNENPYGGSIYGIEEASKTYFSKKASDLTLAQAAYLASLPQAPTYYSPYGNNRDKLDSRKNLVLSKMLEQGRISQEEYDAARAEKVTFEERGSAGIKAPHFVEYVRQYLEEKYGAEALLDGGYKVITTLDYEKQKIAEELVKKFALQNEEVFGAENASLVAIDPKTGGILTMVGSRDYFDTKIDGNFNVALGKRQPGSSFKPFVYAEAFTKGYTPETVLFDVETEFSAQCDGEGKPLPGYEEAKCYKPGNFDDKFRGPMTLRSALAESRNIPAVKTLYLAGLVDSLRLAKDMGISTLTDVNRYGLTLVLGGGEVTLLDMTGAYAAFADEGLHNDHHAIERIEDSKGKVIESWEETPNRVLPANVANQISSILSDDEARVPTYGPHSNLYFAGHDVAAKTGTTNDYRDVWVIGYTPSIVVGAWAGNNDNRPMERKVAGQIITPMWNAVMNEFLKSVPNESFNEPEPTSKDLKPVLRGIWEGGRTFTIDSVSGKLATEYTPESTKVEKAIPEIHSILYWLDKDDPNGPAPEHPEEDQQFEHWEFAVRKWAEEHGYKDQPDIKIPTQEDDVHVPEKFPKITIDAPQRNSTYKKDETVVVNLSIKSSYGATKADFYVNGSFAGSSSEKPFSFAFNPEDIENIGRENELRVVVYDSVGNSGEAKTIFNVSR